MSIHGDITAGLVRPVQRKTLEVSVQMTLNRRKTWIWWMYTTLSIRIILQRQEKVLMLAAVLRFGFLIKAGW